jgi:hypothetical protein
MVEQSGSQPPLRRAEAHGNQQISRPENLPGLGNRRTMKDQLTVVNIPGRGDKDVAQVAAKVKLEMPK